MKTLLIVDDHAAHLRLYKKEFEKEGFSVLTTQSGAEALAWMETKGPDLVILDLMIMSDMDGPDILDRLTHMKPDLPVIVNTGGYAIHDPSSMRGASAYVLKSANLDELKSKVRKFSATPVALYG